MGCNSQQQDQLKGDKEGKKVHEGNGVLQDEKERVECEYQNNGGVVGSLQEIKNCRKVKFRQLEKMMIPNHPIEYHPVEQRIRLVGLSGRLQNEDCGVEDPFSGWREGILEFGLGF